LQGEFEEARSDAPSLGMSDTHETGADHCDAEGLGQGKSLSLDSG
jgi:hypothetical protein